MPLGCSGQSSRDTAATAINGAGSFTRSSRVPLTCVRLLDFIVCELL